MKYYVIINGESSLDIQGLAIESLPSISKPLMRSKREEIDGRNGDIITQLGFSAYDKTLKIGLWGDYDINEVITFFNQEGTITFSNEPDMYYNFTILNRIDFINQLEAFRKATITIHCQPFKYKEEETETLEIEEHQEEGTSFNLESTIEAPMQIDLKGNTSQVQLSGKNLLGLSNFVSITTDSGITLSNDATTGKVTLNGTTIRNTFITYSTKTFNVNDIVSLSANNSTINGDVAIRLYNITTGGTTPNVNFDAINKISENITLSNVFDGFQIRIASGTTLNNYVLYPQIEKNITATDFEVYCGGTPSPNPDYPQDIHNVSGDNDIVVCGKNLFDKDNANYVNGWITSTTMRLNTTNGNRMFYIPCKPNTTYTISRSKITSSFRTTTYDSTPFPTVTSSNVDYTVPTVIENNSGTSLTITTGANAKYLVVHYGKIEDTNLNETLASIQVELGNQATTYEAYNGTTYPINLPSGMELSKIGTYQDYIYKENDKWYLHKEIGKVVLNGSESYTSMGYSSNRYAYRTTITNLKQTTNQSDTSLLLANYYYAISQSGITGENGNGRIANRVNQSDIIIRNDSCTSTTDFKTWLSTHNTSVYYQLATPTNTEITDTTLIDQLNDLEGANSYYGTTNIIQVNNDEMFILGVDYFTGTDNITITNHGNYYSKPKLTLIGTGNIGIYLNDSQIFQVALGTNETIIIDTDKMEAYYESTLKNRQVIGDYNSFKLLSGENTIRISGTFSKLQIDNYSRWI